MSKKVLVVEDYEGIRRMMKLVLGFRGYQVVEAQNGREAVEKAIEEKPDLILMDIGMPVMDGLDATQDIRAHSELAGVPIVALTAYGDFYTDKALAAGCNDVVHKPIDFEHLEPLVERYVM